MTQALEGVRRAMASSFSIVIPIEILKNAHLVL